MKYLLAMVTAALALPEPGGAQSLRVTYLANMGVQLSAGGTTVVIDALHRGRLPGYTALLPDAQRAIEEGRPPLERIAVALVTHRHLDHFDADAALARLARDTALVLVGPTEVIDTLVARQPSLRRDPRLRGVRGGERLQVNGVSIHVLDLPHNPTRTPLAQNVGYVIELAGHRVLHTGDADPRGETFLTRGVRAMAIHTAVVPVWYVTADNGALLEAIGASCFLASHVAPGDTAEVGRRVVAARAGARALATRGLTWQLEATGRGGCTDTR